MAETSGQTTPGEDGNTIFSGRRRNRSLETVISQTTHLDSVSESTTAIPEAPVNSPETLSTVGDYQRQNSIDTAGLAQRLSAMRGSLTSPPASVTAEQHEPQAGPSRSNDFAHKRHTSIGSPLGKNKDDPTFEHSAWEDYAEEDVNRALARLARLARDEQQKDAGDKPVSAYYSARLAKLIKSGEIEFDVKFLQ